MIGEPSTVPTRTSLAIGRGLRRKRWFRFGGRRARHVDQIPGAAAHAPLGGFGGEVHIVAADRGAAVRELEAAGGHKMNLLLAGPWRRVAALLAHRRPRWCGRRRYGSRGRWWHSSDGRSRR